MSPRSIFFSSWAVLACSLPVAAAASGAAADHRTVGGYLEEIAAAYFNPVAHFPSEFLCEMESPELVASLDSRARRAWGDAVVVVSRSSEGFRMTASGLADPRSKGLFDLALAAWQIRLGLELKILEGYLPSATAAIVVGVLASPWTHEAFDEASDQGRRFGLRARSAEHAVQELELRTSPRWELRGATLKGNDGSELELSLESTPYPWAGERYVVTEIGARVRKRDGEIEIVDVELAFRPVIGREDVIIPSLIRVRRENEAGERIRRHRGDVNPISFQFSNCVID